MESGTAAQARRRRGDDRRGLPRRPPAQRGRSRSPIRTKGDELSIDLGASWRERSERARRRPRRARPASTGDTIALMLGNRPEFHLVRHRRDAARRDAVLDLPDLRARARSSTSSRTPAREIVITEPAFLANVLEARKNLPGPRARRRDRRRRARGLHDARRRRGRGREAGFDAEASVAAHRRPTTC